MSMTLPVSRVSLAYGSPSPPPLLHIGLDLLHTHIHRRRTALAGAYIQTRRERSYIHTYI